MEVKRTPGSHMASTAVAVLACLSVLCAVSGARTPAIELRQVSREEIEKKLARIAARAEGAEERDAAVRVTRPTVSNRAEVTEGSSGGRRLSVSDVAQGSSPGLGGSASVVRGTMRVGRTPSGFARRDDHGRIKLWVFFKDKALLDAADELAAIEDFRSRLSPRALWRREKVGKSVDVRDLPLAGEYVRAVEEQGARVVARSRWLNAVSVYAYPRQVGQISRLPFVERLRPVMRATKERPVFTTAPPRGGAPDGQRSLDYGPSLDQLDQIQVPDLHDDGFDGTGIIVAMLDTGFDTDHQVYRHLNIIAEHDFINDDGETADEPGDPENQDSHGTATLSCVGGAYAGELYGGSYNAGFILCKTEILDEEIEIEEDYWVEAVEWADSLGADLVSSSLGYFYWYTYEDMDGDTAVTTIAADLAAARGIVVVNSMGNEGDGDWKYMIAPADGDTVLSIGAVNSEGERKSWSSVGPTYDGRIKPDVMALGSHVYVATTEDTASYAESGGTSFSCPLTAGAVGLLLEGHPSWSPYDVGEAVRSTATQSSNPDTLMGWGILQSRIAMYSQPLGVDGEHAVDSRLLWTYPNPFSPQTVVRYFVPELAHVRLEIFDVAGRLVRVLQDGEKSAGTFTVAWDGKDASGARAASGVYFCRLAVGERGATSKITLLR